MQDAMTYCFTGPGKTYGSSHVHQVRCRTGSPSAGQAHTHAIGACCDSCAKGGPCSSSLGDDAFPAKTVLVLGAIALAGIFVLPRVMGKMY